MAQASTYLIRHHFAFGSHVAGIWSLTMRELDGVLSEADIYAVVNIIQMFGLHHVPGKLRIMGAEFYSTNTESEGGKIIS